MMRIGELAGQVGPTVGQSMVGLIRRLFPIFRSITGEGVRTTLDVLGENLPLARHDVASGTRVLDWVVPQEWTIRDAYVADRDGRRVIDVRDSNLHLLHYSVPVRRRMSLAELRPHLHTLPGHPDWIPYRTSYYRRTWGFCLRHRDLERLPAGDYEVVIDSELGPGHLSYGELLIPGESEREVLLSTHICHPSLANDNLSGVAVLAELAAQLMRAERRYSYRLLFIPGTIGAITWLARNQEHVGRVDHGLVLAGVGDRGTLTYKRSYAGDRVVDRAAQHVLSLAKNAHRLLDFRPDGYDERQFNAPGFRLPVGRLSRSEHGTYPEYHTSADDLEFITARSLEGSLQAVLEILAVIEENALWRNTAPLGEPQLGRRGLEDLLRGQEDPGRLRMAALWALCLGDGTVDTLGMAERAGMPFPWIAAAIRNLAAVGLMERVEAPGSHGGCGRPAERRE